MSHETDAFLEHYGIKGMKWGVRRQSRGTSDTSKSSESSNKNLKRAAVGVAIVGAGAAAYLLHKNGMLPMSALKSSPKTSRGREAARRISNNPSAEYLKFKSIAAEFEKQLADANKQLYKDMVNDAAAVGVPTISKADFDNIRN